MIAGKVIPSIININTVSSITGLACLQILTLLHTKSLSCIKDAYLNSAVSSYELSEPMETKKTKDILEEYNQSKAIPKNFTCWDKIIINGSQTLQTFKQFINYFKLEYGVDVILVNSSNYILYKDTENELK